MIPKFRAWVVSRKRFEQVQQLVWHKDDLTRVITSHSLMIQTNLPEDVILMQSTGLFDKNGVEIFEGDVVTYNSSKSNYIVSFGQFICYFSAYNKRGENILRLAPGYGWYLKHFRDSFWNVSGEGMDEPAKIEVIGNIHEHPHLVEETT